MKERKEGKMRIKLPKFFTWRDFPHWTECRKEEVFDQLHFTGYKIPEMADLDFLFAKRYNELTSGKLLFLGYF